MRKHAVLLKQLARVKVVVEVVIDAVAANAHVTVAQASGNLFTPSAGEDAVFQRDNNAVPIGQGRNELLVKFRGEARVDKCGLGPMLSKGSYDPFAKLDQTGVGKLVDMACKLGRQTNPGLELGICGEHGGDPSSIAFCHKVGLDYVSCSPFRVPIARLAAAQAAIRDQH